MIPDEAIFASGARIVIYGLVLLAGWRMRKLYHWPIGAAIVCAIASNIFLIEGMLSWSGLVAMPFAGLNAYIYLKVMREDPSTLKALLGAKEAQWSRERHDLREEVAVLQARLKYPGAK